MDESMVITLCGSARFELWYHVWNEALSLAGHCVFSLAAYPSHHNGDKGWYTKEQKKTLDRVHKLKIDASEAIFVLNVFAYMGDSTLSEIKHARAGGKKTYFLESWGKGLGIDHNHFDYIQHQRDKFKVPEGFGSPITTVASAACLPPWDLLGEAGESRSSIVSMLHRRLDGYGA